MHTLLQDQVHTPQTKEQTKAISNDSSRVHVDIVPVNLLLQIMTNILFFPRTATPVWKSHYAEPLINYLKKNGAEYAQALGKTTPTIPRTTQAMITMQEGNAYHTSFQAWFWCWGLLFIQHSTSSAPTARIKWQTWSSQRMKNRNSARGFLPGWGARARSWSGSVKRE